VGLGLASFQASTPPVFDRLRYAKTEGEGEEFIT